MWDAYLKNKIYNMHHGSLFETNGFILKEKNDSVIITVIY